MIREYINIFKITKKAAKQIKRLKSKDINVDVINSDIDRAWNEYKKAVGKELLNKMPIERLNDVEVGMPINALKKHGIKYIGDCSNKSAQYFERFPGIGNVRSQKIVAAANALTKATFDEFNFQIKENSKSEALLRALNKKMKYVEREKDIIEFNKDRVEMQDLIIQC